MDAGDDRFEWDDEPGHLPESLDELPEEATTADVGAVAEIVLRVLRTPDVAAGDLRSPLCARHLAIGRLMIRAAADHSVDVPYAVMRIEYEAGVEGFVHGTSRRNLTAMARFAELVSSRIEPRVVMLPWRVVRRLSTVADDTTSFAELALDRCRRGPRCDVPVAVVAAFAAAVPAQGASDPALVAA
jgi:hypothetical protein